MLKLIRIAMIAALLIPVVAGCRHSAHRQATRPGFDPALMKLSKEQLFQNGEEQFAKKKYPRARTFYTQLYENFPNDPLGRRALLRIADTYYAQGDDVNLVEAQYKYRDFLNRYPGSESADYAMLQIAMCSYKQMGRPDRDLQKTNEALEKFNDMINAFPRSPLRPEADKRRQEVLDRLARHEHVVARFYLKRHAWNAAMQRLNAIVDTYPNYADRAGVFYDLGTALSGLGRKGEARLYYERVISEFPKSDYADRARRKLDQLKAA